MEYDDYLPPDDDRPTSETEARAEEETARMELLLDRIEARLEKEGGRGDPDSYERIMEEERERLRKERGEPEPEPPTPEQEEEQARWIEEMNAAAEEALEDDSDAWKGEDEFENHPLQGKCSDLAVRLHKEVDDAGWVEEAVSREHPLIELVRGTMTASAKLAGALNSGFRESEWPPDPLVAGDSLVRLKKARRALTDARAGARSAREDGLATPEWLAAAEKEVVEILEEVETLVAEIRSSLE